MTAEAFNLYSIFSFYTKFAPFEEVKKWVSTISLSTSDELNGGGGIKPDEDTETSNPQSQKEFGNVKFPVLIGSGLALLVVVGGILIISRRNR